MDNYPTGWLAKLLGAPESSKGYSGEAPPEGYEYVYDKSKPFGKRVTLVKKPKPIAWAGRVFNEIEANPNDINLEPVEPQGGAGREGNIIVYPGKLQQQIIDQTRAYEEVLRQRAKKAKMPPTTIVEPPSKPSLGIFIDGSGKRHLKVQ